MRKSITELCSMPGSYLVDNPDSKKKVAAIVAGLTFAVLPATPALAAHHTVKPQVHVQKIVKNPGGVSQYGMNIQPNPGGVSQY